MGLSWFSPSGRAINPIGIESGSTQIMSVHQVHVFISHSWAYSRHYETLAAWIFGQAWRFGQASIRFHNYSVPHWDPFVDLRADRLLRDAIFRQIRRCHVIVIPTGMYAHYSAWISKELDGAALYGKPILAVDLWGARRTSSVVVRAAHRHVRWNARSVVGGIWELYYRGV